LNFSWPRTGIPFDSKFFEVSRKGKKDEEVWTCVVVKNFMREKKISEEKLPQKREKDWKMNRTKNLPETSKEYV